MSQANRKTILVLSLIALLATLIYSNTFSVPFHFDDPPNITENPQIKHLENFSDLSNSRYVGFLTFALNYRFGGFDVFGYHLVNLLIHIANGFLVYVLVLLLFRAVNQPLTTPLIALATALLFIAHPIQTQAVTYIVQRFTSLAAFFYLLGVIGYLKWRLKDNSPHPPLKLRGGKRGCYVTWYIISFLSCLLGMKTKEFVFTLPLMLVLIEVVFFAKRRWIALIPFLLTLLIIPLSRFEALGEADQLAIETDMVSRADYLFTQFRVIVTYLRLLVLPVGQNLDYEYAIYRSFFAPPVFFSFLFLSSLFATAVYLLRRTARQPSPVNSQLKLIAFGIFWFFLTLSVESSIIPIRDLIFEHRLYLPSIGAFLAVCAALASFASRSERCAAGSGMVSSRRRFLGLLSMGMIILIFSAATYQRNKVWQDEMTLWKDVVRKSPNKARPYNNLGNAYKDMGRLEEAILEYQTAVRLKPSYAMAYYNLGNIYGDQGHLEEAVRQYQIALQLQPNYAAVHYNLGVTYKDQGRLDEAIQEYQIVTKLHPGYADGHYNMGNAYKSQGRLDEAIREYQAALQFEPDHADAHNNLGASYFDQGRLDEAIREHRIVLQLRPDAANAHNNLGSDYKNQGCLDDAIREYRTALQLQPDYAMAHYNLGVVYRDQGDLKGAILEYQSALQLQPDFSQARKALDMLKGATSP